MNTQLKEELIDLKIKVNRARFNLMFMILLSLINIYLIITNNKFQMPFSCSISSFAVAFGNESFIQDGNQLPLILGLIVSAILLGTFLICYFKSKNSILFLVAPIGIILVDTLALFVISIATSSIGSTNFLLDFIFHILSIFYLIKGITSAKQIKILSEKSNSIDSTATNLPENEPESDLYKPIGKYTENGEILLEGTYNGLKIFVSRGEFIELVVNNYICDRLDITESHEYELSAFVNEIHLVFRYSKNIDNEVMYLYADETLLDSKTIG